MLAEKLRPKRIAQLVGNAEARLELYKWLKHWKTGDKALLLTGPPGVGKSTSIYAVADELGYSVLEYNASDVRTRDRLREALSPAVENASLVAKEKLLIFLDEIDGISGRADYAGMDFVLDFIENATMPVAMAANLEDTQKLKKIEQKSLVVRFNPVPFDVLTIYLKAISSREDLEIPDTVLEKIARNSRGDVRQALNSLQTISGKKIVGSLTDHQFMSDASAVNAILKSQSMSETLTLLREYDAQPYNKIRALFDSVVSAKNLSVESKADSLRMIADADLVLGKIQRGGSWRLLRYFDRYLAGAVVGKKIARSDSSIPWNLKLAIWNDGRILKHMGIVLSDEYHVGRSDIASLYVPFFAFYFKYRPAAMEDFLERNNFSDSERRVLTKLTVRK